MSKSSLVNVNVPANESNFTYGRSGYGINAVTIHHMAGILSAEQCGYIFQQPDRYGSSHYGIGNDGRIGQYVDEENTAWTNSNWESNCQSVTIETSNCEIGGNWAVSDEALNSLIKLVADIAKRNNLGKLVKGVNLTWHSMFAATECPGAYLLSKLDYIVEEANKINNEPQPPTPTPTEYNVNDEVEINGVYISSDSTTVLPPLVTKGIITYKNTSYRNPYLLNDGDIGWVNNECIVRKINNDPTTDFKVGDYVVPTVLVDYQGNQLVQYDDLYQIIDKDERGNLLGAVRGDERPIWAILPDSNIRKA